MYDVDRPHTYGYADTGPTASRRTQTLKMWKYFKPLNTWDRLLCRRRHRRHCCSLFLLRRASVCGQLLVVCSFSLLAENFAAIESSNTYIVMSMCVWRGETTLILRWEYVVYDYLRPTIANPARHRCFVEGTHMIFGPIIYRYLNYE